MAADLAQSAGVSLTSQLAQRHESNLFERDYREGRPRFTSIGPAGFYEGVARPLYQDPTDVMSRMSSSARNTGDLRRARETMMAARGVLRAPRYQPLAQVGPQGYLESTDLNPSDWYRRSKQSFEQQQIRQAMSRAMSMYPVGSMPSDSLKRTYGMRDDSGAMSSAEAGYVAGLDYGAHSGDYTSHAHDETEAAEPATKNQRG